MGRRGREAGLSPNLDDEPLIYRSRQTVRRRRDPVPQHRAARPLPGLQRWIDRNPEEADAFLAAIPMKWLGDCEADIGRAVVALCGPDLQYLTGATIPLDGGQGFFGRQRPALRQQRRRQLMLRGEREVDTLHAP